MINKLSLDFSFLFFFTRDNFKCNYGVYVVDVSVAGDSRSRHTS